MTRSSAPISLFAEPSIATRRPSSFVLSIVVHTAVIGVVYFGVTHLPRIENRALLEHYAVRQLDLHPLDPNFPEQPAAMKRSIPYPGADVVAHASPALPPELTDAMRLFLGSAAGRQILIQPQFQTHLSFAQQVPLPNVMIWTPDQTSKKKIVPPLPNPPAAAHVIPSLELPNQEIKLADVALATTDLSPRKQPMPAATTTPLENHSASLVKMEPATIFESLELPTPTAVLSISDLRMPDGTVLLPPVNDLGPLNAGKSAGSAHANPGGDRSSLTDNGAAAHPAAASAADGDNIAADGRRLSTEHIVLPRDGKFTVVVVGSTLAEQYPETLEIWANRVAYTAYLHVGLKKNWILQYATTRAVETANQGRLARLEAPWPYDLARPNLLSQDLNSDALMVHGVLNQAGRLESLAIAFPSGFRYASFVLHALRQWQFRPARQNGQATAVEVLLIIPDNLE